MSHHPRKSHSHLPNFSDAIKKCWISCQNIWKLCPLRFGMCLSADKTSPNCSRALPSGTAAGGMKFAWLQSVATECHAIQSVDCTVAPISLRILQRWTGASGEVHISGQDRWNPFQPVHMVRYAVEFGGSGDVRMPVLKQSHTQVLRVAIKTCTGSPGRIQCNGSRSARGADLLKRCSFG